MPYATHVSSENGNRDVGRVECPPHSDCAAESYVPRRPRSLIERDDSARTSAGAGLGQPAYDPLPWMPSRPQRMTADEVARVDWTMVLARRARLLGGITR